MAILGAGAVIQVAIANVLTTLTGIKTISSPKIGVTVIDITVLLSPQHTKQKVGGFIDPGEVTFGGVFIPAVYATLHAYTGLTKIWRVLLSNGSHWDFEGFLKSVSCENPLDAEVSMEFTIEVSGVPAFSQ